jgi:hypothetical protein
MRISNGKRFVNPLDKESWMWFNYDEVANKLKEERMDWNKILNGGTEEIRALLLKHKDTIGKTYDGGGDDKGLDINLKLVMKPGKDEKISMKADISFTTERVTDNRKSTVSTTGDLFHDDGADPGADPADTGSED